jgi:hypothetical protein
LTKQNGCQQPCPCKTQAKTCQPGRQHTPPMWRTWVFAFAGTLGRAPLIVVFSNSTIGKPQRHEGTLPERGTLWTMRCLSRVRRPPWPQWSSTDPVRGRSCSLSNWRAGTSRAPNTSGTSPVPQTCRIFLKFLWLSWITTQMQFWWGLEYHRSIQCLARLWYTDDH